VATIQNPLTRTGDASRAAAAAAHEYFIEPTDASCREITVSKVRRWSWWKA
jgi:hypothetical protein